MSATVQSIDANKAEREQTDGFISFALKLNGSIHYGVPAFRSRISAHGEARHSRHLVPPRAKRRFAASMPVPDQKPGVSDGGSGFSTA